MEFQSRAIKVEDEPGGKRRATAEEWTANKKRALSSMSDSPVAVNGTVDDFRKHIKTKEEDEVEPQEEDDLERFRKAAIFRRMRYYQRDYHRAVKRYEKIEHSFNDCVLAKTEAEACWQSVIDVIRRLTDVDALCSRVSWGKVEGDPNAALKPSRVFHPRDLETTRVCNMEKIEATEKVILALIALAKDGKLDPPTKEVLVRDSRELQQSNAFLRAETERVYELYEDAQHERDKYLSELRIAESKIDRLQSNVLNPILHQDPELRVKVNGKASTDGKDDTGANSESAKEASPPVVQSLLLQNGNANSHDDLKAMIDSREDRLNELEKENASLRTRVVDADTNITLLSEEVVMNTSTYRVLLSHASKLQANLEGKEKDITRLNEEITSSLADRTKWQEEIVAAASKEADELRQVLKKRDEEITRIRQQRDKIEADFKELETVHKSKWSSIGKFKVQASERRKRIEVLQSEVRRLASRLAANDKQEHLLDFLLGGKDLDTYPSLLDSQRRELEKEVEGLRSLVKASKSGLEDYGRLRVELESTRKRLEKYESTDKGELMKQLDKREEEIRALKLKDKESTAAMDSLYSEVEKLSLSWEELQSQLADQVITLERWEEEREKLSVAKAKADNRYYKAMGDVEAKEKERRAAQNAMDKYVKAWEAGKEVEKSLHVRFRALEESIALQKNTLAHYERKHDTLTKELSTTKSNLEIEEKRVELLQLQLQSREDEFAEVNMNILKMKDEVQKWKKEAEKASIRAKAPPSTASEREEELQSEIDKFMKVLKCSTCNGAMRNTVITKCMHSFCKGCVDARISHRQRKCPACNLAFSQSDVQTLYFQ